MAVLESKLNVNQKSINELLSEIEELRAQVTSLQESSSRLDKVKKSLKASEKKYLSLFESEGDAVFLAEASTGTLIDCNKKAEELIGRTRSEIIGMNQAQLHPPDKAEQYKNIFKTIMQNLNLKFQISIASANPSPIKLNIVTVINMAKPGNTDNHHAE